MKPIIKTQAQPQVQYINGRQVKSIQRWSYVYFVQFVSGRPSFVSFKELDENNQQNESEVEIIKVFLEDQLPCYTIQYVIEEYGVKFCTTYNPASELDAGRKYGIRIPLSSYKGLARQTIFRLKDNDIHNVANVIKEDKFEMSSVYEKFYTKFKVFSI
jgi:hypothetical protein